MLTNVHRRPERMGYEKILYTQHLDRVSTIKPVIDTSAPRPLPYNNKRERERIRKNNLIDFENRCILERIASVIQQSSLDNKLDKHINEYSKFKQLLYRTVHRSRLNQITQENLNLLKRIQTVNPVYSACQMEEEYKKNQEIMKQMCIY